MILIKWCIKYSPSVFFTLKGVFIKSGYHPTSKCPTNEKDWTASSHRLKCNATHKYHCAPYYDHSQLYEFCYDRTVLTVKKGKFLEFE